MARARLVRMAQGTNTTLSHLYINEIFRCYLLEDSIRDVKIYGATCIPAGVYSLKLNLWAGMNTKYKKRFPSVHEGMIEIDGIPNYSLVFIHIGNTHLETLGCPLTGRSWSFVKGDYQVAQSALAYESLYVELRNILIKGPAKIEVVNHLRIDHGF